MIYIRFIIILAHFGEAIMGIILTKAIRDCYRRGSAEGSGQEVNSCLDCFDRI